MMMTGIISAQLASFSRRHFSATLTLPSVGLGQGQNHGDGADTALRGAVEGRAVFEQDLHAAMRPKPVQCRQRLRNRLFHRNAARFQCDDPGLDHRISRLIRNAGILGDPHALLGKGVGQIAGAGEIIAYTAKKHHRAFAECSVGTGVR